MLLVSDLIIFWEIDISICSFLKNCNRKVYFTSKYDWWLTCSDLTVELWIGLYFFKVKVMLTNLRLFGLPPILAHLLTNFETFRRSLNFHFISPSYFFLFCLILLFLPSTSENSDLWSLQHAYILALWVT